MTRPLLVIAVAGFAVSLAATTVGAAPRAQSAWRGSACQFASQAPQSRSHGHFGGHHGRRFDRHPGFRSAPPRRHVPPPPPWGYMSPPRHYYDNYYWPPRKLPPRHYSPRYHDPRWYDPYDRHWR